MITISAFKSVPVFARGQVRDLRIRWALEEAGLPYTTLLLEQGDQVKADYRGLQPFGQVPIFKEDNLVLFESGAIVLYIGELSTAAPRGPRSGAQLKPRSTISKRRYDGPDAQAGKGFSLLRAVTGVRLAALDNRG
jgi:hypothetical protein